MRKMVCDFEATGKNPLVAEIIEGYFIDLDTNEEYHFKSKVDKWCESAEKVHQISYNEMLSYPDKKQAYWDLLDWLPKKFTMISYSNMQSELGFLNYDHALLKHNIMDYLNLDSYHKLPVLILSYSIHSLAKELDKTGLIDAPRNPETNRKSFTQENIYSYLFNESYNAHKAEDDTRAAKRIYERLLEIKESGKSITDKNQLELI